MIIDQLWRDQPGKFFFLSTKTASGKWHDHCFRRSDIGKISEFLEEYRDRDIYFCPHGFSKALRRKDCAMLPSMLWSDMDEIDPRKTELRPTIAIESSPGRYVGLWLLDAPMSESLNKRLANEIGEDNGGWDLTQVLRVPGTLNYKYENTPRVKILWRDGPTYRVRDIEKKLPELEDEDTGDEDVGSLFQKWSKKLPHWARRELMRRDKIPVGKRSEMLWKLNNTMLEAGVDTEDIFQLLRASAWNKFAGKDDQLRRELDKAVGRKFRNVAGESEDRDDYRWIATPLSDVEIEDIDWLWRPVLARGEVTIMEGDPGIGKSYIAQMISGMVCDGKKFPEFPKQNGDDSVSGRVVYFDLENSRSTVTKPRVIYNGAKQLENFFQEERPFSIDDDETLDKIFDRLEKLKPMLIVFDTMNTYLGAADAFKGHEAQQAFIKFREIAKRFNCAVLVLRHLTKGTRDSALYRGQGSISMAGVARIVVTVGKTQEGERAMAITKINIDKKPAVGLTFELVERGDKTKFLWGEFVEVTSDELLAATNVHGAKDEVAKFLVAALEDGEVELKRLERMAEARSISRRTLYRAGRQLGVKRKTTGFGPTRCATWSLPDDVQVSQSDDDAGSRSERGRSRRQYKGGVRVNGQRVH